MPENNLAEIKDTLIRRAFSELLGTEIKVEYRELHNALVEYGRLTGDGFFIEVDTLLKEAPREVVEGGLAHDLAHISKDKNKKGISKLSDMLLYQFSKEYRKLDERDTDVLVVIRGKGKELLEFLRYSEKNLDLDYYEDEGLSVLELAALLVSK